MSEPRVPRRAGGLPRADRRAVRGDAARAAPRREDAQARGRQGGAPRVPRDAAGGEADPRHVRVPQDGEPRDEGRRHLPRQGVGAVAEEYYLCADYAEAQKAIVEKVVRIAATFTPVISDAQELIAELDVLLCFAAVARGARAVRAAEARRAEDGASGSSSRGSATRASSGWRAFPSSRMGLARGRRVDAPGGHRPQHGRQVDLHP